MEKQLIQEQNFHPRRVHSIEKNKTDVMLVKKVNDTEVVIIDEFKEKMLNIIRYNEKKTVLRMGDGQVVTHEIAVPLRNVREQIFSIINDQMIILQQALYTKLFFWSFARETWIDGRHIIFFMAVMKGTRKIVNALIEIAVGYYVPRAFYYSHSDYCWRAYIAEHKNEGRIIKGRESEIDHHYVQDSKVYRSLAQILNTIPLGERRSGTQFIVDDFLLREPSEWTIHVDGKEKQLTGTFESEQKVYRFADPEWKDAQRRLMVLEHMYRIINMNKNEKTFVIDEIEYGRITYRWPKDEEKKWKILNNMYAVYKHIPFIVHLVQSLVVDELQQAHKGIDQRIHDAYTELKQFLENCTDTLSFSGTTEEDMQFSELYTNWATSIMSTYIRELPFPQSLIPNFEQSQCLSVYQDTLSGIIRERYGVQSSAGDKIYWDMAINSEQTEVWVEQCVLQNGKMNSFGTESELVHMGLLVFKPYDYAFQTFGLYTKAELKTNATNYDKYVNVLPFWDNFELIQQYKRQRFGENRSKNRHIFEEKDELLWDTQVREEEMMRCTT